MGVEKLIVPLNPEAMMRKELLEKINRLEMDMEKIKKDVSDVKAQNVKNT